MNNFIARLSYLEFNYDVRRNDEENISLFPC